MNEGPTADAEGPVVLSVDDVEVTLEPATPAVVGSAADATIVLGPSWPAHLFRLRFVGQWTFHLLASGVAVTLDDAPVRRPRTVPLDLAGGAGRRLTLTAADGVVRITVRSAAVRPAPGRAPSPPSATAGVRASPPAPSTPPPSSSTPPPSSNPPPSSTPPPSSRQSSSRSSSRPSSRPSSADRTTRADGPPSTHYRVVGRVDDVRRTIGRRGEGADVELDGLDIAGRHASIVRRRGAVELRDLSAALGTYVNGVAILFARLTPSDVVVIGRYALVVDEQGRLWAKALTQPVALRCRDVAATYRGQTAPTISDVGFDLERGTLLAVVGPSGSGKSTLCTVLLGEIRSVSGHCDLGGVDLFAPGSALHHLVNFVPQTDALAGELSVRRTLRYVARLRMAEDVRARDLRTRVDEVIDWVDLGAKASDRVGALSGGQQKRVSIAMELLTRPPLLVLDEPTSGLDEGLDLTVMELLRSIAAEGSAIVLVTHAMANIDRADTVLAMAADGDPEAVRRTGRLAYIGPPSDVLDAFGADRWSVLMLRLGRGAVARTTSRPRTEPRPLPGGRLHPVQAARPRAVVHRIRRIGVLGAREATRLATRRTALLQALVFSPLVAWFFAIFAGPLGLAGTEAARNGRMNVVVGVLAVCTTLFAMAISFTSVVGERGTVERERRWGVTPTEVVVSKFLVTGVIGLAQPLILVVLYGLWRDLPSTSQLGPPTWVGLVVALALLALASVALGLLISTVARTLQQASGLLAIVLAVQVVLSGLFIPLGTREGLLSQLVGAASYLAPTRWAVALIAADSDMARVGAPSEDLLWTGDTGHVVTAASMLVVFVLAPLVIARVLLWHQLRRGR